MLTLVNSREGTRLSPADLGSNPGTPTPVTWTSCCPLSGLIWKVGQESLLGDTGR